MSAKNIIPPMKILIFFKNSLSIYYMVPIKVVDGKVAIIGIIKISRMNLMISEVELRWVELGQVISSNNPWFYTYFFSSGARVNMLS